MNSALLLFGALALEVLIGWPKWLFAWVRHPVVWMGNLIDWLDRSLNRVTLSSATRRILGCLTLIIVVATVVAIATAISSVLPDTPAGFIAEALVSSSLLATRSLYVHVHAVAAALHSNDIQAAREAVRKIVGRDPTALDSAGIARASIESLAENASDGVVAPVFWGVLFGLPGLAGYKAINTLDSMLGHRNDRFRDFGWASARIDDLANLLPARLTALLIVLAGASGRAVAVVLSDSRLHRSPNAGWPESALAGAIGVRVSGPRSYGGRLTEEPWVNGDAPDPDAEAIYKGLRIYAASIVLLALLLAFTAYGVATYGT